MTDGATRPAQPGVPLHQGRVGIVTGASRGIGLAIATRLVRDGAQVVLTGRDAGRLDAAVEGLGGGRHALAVAGHAADADHQRESVDLAVARFGRLDYLVNNTGISPAYGPMLDGEVNAALQAARKVLETNVLAAFAWIKLGVTAGASSVVNLASIAGLGATGSIGWYGVSKAALIHLTTELAYELAPNVRVNAVAPAIVKTRFATALYEGREEEVAAAYPMKRLGVPDDIAGAVAFLLSDDASWVTGQTLVIDGGVRLSAGI